MAALFGWVDQWSPDAIEYFQRLGKPDPAMEISSSADGFSYVRLPISFRPLDGIDLELVSVECEIVAPNGDADAWSMEPMKVEQEI